MQVQPKIKKCVVFISYNSTLGSQLAGTGFFVSIDLKNVKGRHISYVITAKHVIEMVKRNSIDGNVFLRVNTKDGGSRNISCDIDEWKYHEDDSVDVAAFRWVPDSKLLVDYLVLPSTMAVTKKIIEREYIGAGDEVFLTGLFSNHFGKQKNLPIIRTGNIALMPEEKVYTQALGYIDAYLIEARSIGGLSGSPVFVYVGHMRQNKDGSRIQGERDLFYWLGLMHGHWDIPASKKDDIVEDVSSGERVNMGIAIVIPAIKVLELLNCKEYVENRKKAEEGLMKQQEKEKL